MPKHVIIDGYNLLGITHRLSQGTFVANEAAREGLLQDLTRYRQQKGHAVTIVFDGWRDGLGTERREHRSGIQVVYSRRGEQADQVIQRLAKEYGSDCAVVSSDHEVMHSARISGALVLSSAEFAARIRPASSRSPAPPGKDLAGPDEDHRRRSDKKGNPRKLPKALRRRRRELRGF